MVDESCLDLETSLKKLVPEIFDSLPKNYLDDTSDSYEELIQKFCFLNVVFIKSQITSDNQEKEKYKKIIRNLESSKNHVAYINRMCEYFQNNKYTMDEKVYENLVKDNSIIYIIANLNLYELQDQGKIKKLFKKLINSCKKSNYKNEKVKNFFLKNSKEIANICLDLINKSIDESIIFNVGKILKYLIEDGNSLKKILDFNFFKKIYSLTKSEKFVYSTEAFKILCSLVENQELDKNFILNFFVENQKEICKLLNNSLTYSIDKNDEELYLFKRESLKLITLILKSSDFSKFNEFYFNQKENLITIMSLLNHSCSKIKYKAIEILYYCFLEIEYRGDMIKALLLANKTNFEKYFEKLTEAYSDEDIIEKKNYILYELEKLKNSE